MNFEKFYTLFLNFFCEHLVEFFAFLLNIFYKENYGEFALRIFLIPLYIENSVIIPFFKWLVNPVANRLEHCDSFFDFFNCIFFSGSFELLFAFFTYIIVVFIASILFCIFCIILYSFLVMEAVLGLVNCYLSFYFCAIILEYPATQALEEEYFFFFLWCLCFVVFCINLVLFFFFSSYLISWKGILRSCCAKYSFVDFMVVLFLFPYNILLFLLKIVFKFLFFFIFVCYSEIFIRFFSRKREDIHD